MPVKSGRRPTRAGPGPAYSEWIGEHHSGVKVFPLLRSAADGSPRDFPADGRLLSPPAQRPRTKTGQLIPAQHALSTHNRLQRQLAPSACRLGRMVSTRIRTPLTRRACRTLGGRHCRQTIHGITASPGASRRLRTGKTSGTRQILGWIRDRTAADRPRWRQGWLEASRQPARSGEMSRLQVGVMQSRTARAPAIRRTLGQASVAQQVESMIQACRPEAARRCISSYPPNSLPRLALS